MLFAMIRQKYLLQNSHLIVFTLQTRGWTTFKMKLSALAYVFILLEKVAKHV